MLSLCFALVLAATPDASAGPTSLASPALHFERGLKLLEMQEYEEARGELEQALAERDYRLEQVVALYRGLGLVRAYAGDDAGARWAFERLLAIEPSHVLRYTLSPRATFLFEQARQTMRRTRALELTLSAPPVAPFDRPIAIQLRRSADPFALVTRIVLLHRIKGTSEWQRIERAAPAIGVEQNIELPAVNAAQATTEPDGTRGALIELAAVGYGASGWEVVRNPTPDRPYELPVGFDVPGPWYTQWWVWGLIGGGAAALTTGAVLAIVLWPLPEQIPASYEVLP